MPRKRNLFSYLDLRFTADGHWLSYFQAGLFFYRIKLAILFPPVVSSRSSCSQYISVRTIVRQNSGESKRIALHVLSNLRSEYFLSFFLSFFFLFLFFFFFSGKLIIRWKVKYQLLTRNHEEESLPQRDWESWEFRVFRFVMSFPRNERKLYLYRNVKSIQSHRERECLSSVPRSPLPLNRIRNALSYLLNDLNLFSYRSIDSNSIYSSFKIFLLFRLIENLFVKL